MANTLSLRELLREATAPAHARVDALVGPLDSRSAYLRYLEGMHGFLGAAAAVLVEEPRLPALLHVLVGELSTAGVPVAPVASPGMDAPAGPAERLGWGYVTAGASVGARMLHRQATRLDPAPGACRFLRDYADSGLWPEWLQRLSQARLDPGARDRCVAAAKAAFAVAEHSFVRPTEVQHP